METRNIFFAAACGALLGFTSCSQQEPPLDEAAAGPKTLTIKVGAETADATRVTTTDGLVLKWQLNDEIAVVGYDDGGVVKGVSVLQTNDADGTSSSASFTGSDIEDATQYKVYFPKEAVDHTTGAERYQACLNELTASSAADVKVILSSGTDYVANPETGKVILKWESALLQISLENLPLALTGIDKVNFAYETASGWSVDHPLEFPSQTVSDPMTVYIPFIPDGDGVKANGKILVSVYDGTSCWGYTATSANGKTHQKGFRYNVTASSWVQYTGGFSVGTTVWATANVGAYQIFASSETDYGSFYQWGRNKAWASSGNTVTDWDSSNPSGNDWNGGLGPCPPGWRLPTKDEFDALTSLTTKGWKTKSSINGYEFTAGGKTLFFPAAGFRSYDDGTLNDQGDYGSYWSATLHGSDNAWCLEFESIYVDLASYGRSDGISVRCVQN
jgi:uncharacterized protein (TIGR02145 family)